MKVLKRQLNSKSCIICGMENEAGVKAPFYELEDGSVASEFAFKFIHQSYPERTHGGMISALLDEVMGRALWVKEPSSYAVTTTMTITFRRPVPYGVKVKARGYITHNSPRWYSAKGEIYSEEGQLLAEGEARYMKIADDKAFAGGASDKEEMCYDLPIETEEFDFPAIPVETKNR